MDISRGNDARRRIFLAEKLNTRETEILIADDEFEKKERDLAKAGRSKSHKINYRIN